MSDVEARAASRSRSRRRRSSSRHRLSVDELQGRLSSHEHRDSLGEVAEDLDVPLEEEINDEDDGETTSATAAAAVPDRGTDPTLPADIQERLRAQDYWYDLTLQLRTHCQSLWNYVLATPHNVDAADIAARNDITDETALSETKTGYHDYLCRLAATHPEAAIPLWHAFRSLGGRFTRDRLLGTRDEAFVVTVPARGELSRWHVNLKREEDLRAFRQMLMTPKSEDEKSIRAVIVPDLSPLFVELLGGSLNLDHRIFSNHLWCENFRPFLVPNASFLDARANNSDPENTTMLEIETEAVMYIRKNTVPSATERAQARLRQLAFFRQSPSFFPFLDRTFEPWPASLATASNSIRDLTNSFHAASRATVHWIEDPASPVQVVILLTPSNSWAIDGTDEYTCKSLASFVHCGDYNRCFLHSSRPDISALDQKPASEGDRYCKDIERLLHDLQQSNAASLLSLESCLLRWLAEKFIASTAQHVQIDTRRLGAFRHAQDPKASTRRRTGAPDMTPDAESAHDPLRDLQYLRDRVSRRERAAENLIAQIDSVCTRMSILTDYGRETATLRLLAAFMSNITKRLGRLQSQINSAQSDVSASLQRRLTLLQLEEARKSISQGAMVRKLTVLAFVFVPLSATASAFGMNLGPLLANPPPVYSFVVASVGLTLLLVALASADYIASTVRGIRSTAVKASPHAVADPKSTSSSRTNTDRTPPLSRQATPAIMKMRPSLRERTVGVPAALVFGFMDGVRLATLPLRLGIKIIQHVHDEGKAIREREDREVDNFLRARFAFDEGPGRVWWEGIGRGWRGQTGKKPIPVPRQRGDG